jgi:hypothetical protein
MAWFQHGKQIIINFYNNKVVRTSFTVIVMKNSRLLVDGLKTNLANNFNINKVVTTSFTVNFMKTF